MSGWLDLVIRAAPLFFQGACMTTALLFSSGALSLVLGLFFGLLCCNQLRTPYLSFWIEGICFIARGIPFFVQLLIVYFVMPDLLGWNLSPFFASVIALGVCSSGYVAQFVRSTLNAIPIAQWESASMLGYSTLHTFLRIIFPQMLRSVLPLFNNELDALLKSTSIVSSIGLLELTRVGMNLVSREMEPLPIYLTLACFYLSMSAVLHCTAKIWERKVSYVKN